MFIKIFSLGSRVAGMLSLLTSLSVIAQDQVSPSSVEAASFQQCISELQDRALLSGVSQNVVTDVLGNVRYREKIISLDRSQPEFVQTFTDYFAKRVTPWRLQKGQEMLAKHRDFLAKLTRQYGVPGTYLLAFWGLETNFGSYKGTSPVFDSLATLACDNRRSNYFSGELIQALLLLERDMLQVKDMVGSWAGAMGQTQFMPSAYMKYAKDGDHDGQINLWSSEQDALASAANFLVHLGWKSGYKWGREVLLPEDFDYQLAGKDSSQSLSFWASQGVTQTDGSPLGAGELQGSLLIPAGHQGPAFLAYQNFDVILGWNNSEYYAIAVGHLADRIAGKKPLSKDLPVLPNYTLSEMQQLQNKLNELGFDVGKADGILGPGTRKGVRGYQFSQGMIADGYPARDVFEALSMEPGEQASDSQ
ncbi:MAG: membrane-bound lytic murein transglycosylase B [Paraglaciecola sp.]